MKKLPFLFIIVSSLIFAQDKDEAEKAALAKATQNPLAAMYSLPFQNNTTFGNAPHDRPQNVMNIQPVIPVTLTKDLNLINRVILPVITQPDATLDKSSTGIGDTSYTAWISPSKAGKIIYGVGPALQIPTASNDEFGTGEFGVGPSLVALTMIDKWVAGIVVNNVWTFGDVKENKFLFQYFVNYNLPKAWYVVSAPIMTANWNESNRNKWTIPVGGGVGKVFKIGNRPINFNAQVYYNAERPEGFGEFQTRFQLQFLFPKKKK